MITIGLTGSIAMGKSTVAAMLSRLGCATHDSDACVAAALQPYGAAFESVALTFPDCWDKKKRVIKKDVLSDLIFNDDAARAALENILHPIVQQSQRDFTRQQHALSQKTIALDIPLLFETGAERRVDYTIIVSAPYHIQRRRVLSRPNMTADKFEAILKTQMPDVQKRALADFIIPTGLGMAYSYTQLKTMLRKIK